SAATATAQATGAGTLRSSGWRSSARPTARANSRQVTGSGYATQYVRWMACSASAAASSARTRSATWTRLTSRSHEPTVSATPRRAAVMRRGRAEHPGRPLRVDGVEVARRPRLGQPREMEHDVRPREGGAERPLVVEPRVAVAQVQPFEPAARRPGTLHADDLVATRDERLDQMTADEPRSARHHRAHADLLDVALAEQSRAQRSRR